MLDIECVTVRTVQPAGAGCIAVWLAVRRYRLSSGRARAAARQAARTFRRHRRSGGLVETHFKAAFAADTGRRLFGQVRLVRRVPFRILGRLSGRLPFTF